MSSSTDKFVFGLLLGLLGGAAYGLLTAPRAGKETRDIIRTNIKERSDKAAEEVANRVTDIREHAAEQANNVANKVGELKDQATEQVHQAATTAKKQVSELKTSAEELAQHYESKGRETLSKISSKDD